MKSDVTERIEQCSRLNTLSSGKTMRSISVVDICTIADNLGLQGRLVEIAALEVDIVPERYMRNMECITIEEQVRLLESHAAVVGLGGLGGFVLEILARLGVGTLTLIDFDRFFGHNLNRQLLCMERAMGVSKAEAARERISLVNSSLCLHVWDESLGRHNGERLLGHPEVIVDCLDTIHARFMLKEVAEKVDRPLVSGAVGGACGHITTIFPYDAGYTALYGEGTVMKGREKSIGVVPQVVAMVASIQSSEVMKVILNKGGLLRNSILMIDLSSNTFETMSLE